MTQYCFGMALTRLISGVHSVCVNLTFMGMKDLAYLTGSCLGERECERQESVLLDDYFDALRQALVAQQSELDLDALERDWRVLYPVAWTDFHRFLKGWSPGHWKINGYSERIVREVVASLQDGA